METSSTNEAHIYIIAPIVWEVGGLAHRVVLGLYTGGHIKECVIILKLILTGKSPD